MEPSWDEKVGFAYVSKQSQGKAKLGAFADTP